jgi:hypothetical protein
LAQDIRVKQIIMHPAYDPKVIINDIGVMKVSGVGRNIVVSGS